MTEHRQALPKGYRLSDAYVIKAVIGHGGFGITYKAFDEPLNTDVAIKEYFPASLAMRNPDWSTQAQSADKDADYAKGMKRFEREMRSLSLFSHPGILRVLKLFSANNTAYAVLDFEEGQTLGAWARSQEGAPAQDVLDTLVRPLLDALETVHNKGILHRDISPGNIIVRPDGSPVLIDFGLARQYTANVSAQSSSIIVTHGFSPPEQYRLAPEGQIPPSDLYSLGATLYYLVTGEVPAKSDAREMAVVSHTPDPLKPTSEAVLRNGYRPQFLAAIDWSLRLDPRERPQTVADWRTRLFAKGPVTKPIFTKPTERMSLPRATAGRRRTQVVLTGVVMIMGAGTYFGWQEVERMSQAAADASKEAETHYKQGKLYSDKKDFTRAIVEFTKTIELDPNEAWAYFWRGKAYFDKKNYDLAISDFNKAIDLDPKNVMPYISRGFAYKKKKDYDLAISDFNTAIDLEPTHAGIYQNRGDAYYYNADYDRAIADFDKAIDLDSNNVRAYHNRGNAHVNKKDYERAIADYDKAIDLNPKSGSAYYNRGWAYEKTGATAKAIADFRKALEIDPTNVRARHRLERLGAR